MYIREIQETLDHTLYNPPISKIVICYKREKNFYVAPQLSKTQRKYIMSFGEEDNL
jgi:hypothetical protein